MTSSDPTTSDSTSPVEPFFFLHVTKCGGTSLRAAFRRAFAELGVDPAAIHELNAPLSTTLGREAGIDVFMLRDLLLATTLDQSGIRFVSGHYRYTRQFHESLIKRCLSVTVLRQPVERFLSLYFYNHYKEDDYGRETLSLEEYVDKPRARRCAEDYVRLFRGTGVEHSEFVTDEEVRLAVGNLALFDVVGTLDNLGAFVRKIGSLTGLDLSIETLNQSPAPKHQRYGEIEPELMTQIENLCQPSIEVYEAAKRYAPEYASGVTLDRRSA